MILTKSMTSVNCTNTSIHHDNGKGFYTLFVLTEDEENSDSAPFHLSFYGNQTEGEVEFDNILSEEVTLDSFINSSSRRVYEAILGCETQIKSPEETYRQTNLTVEEEDTPGFGLEYLDMVVEMGYFWIGYNFSEPTHFKATLSGEKSTIDLGHNKDLGVEDGSGYELDVEAETDGMVFFKMGLGADVYYTLDVELTDMEGNVKFTKQIVRESDFSEDY